MFTDTDIRTRNITGGILEVKINGLWGAVCYDGFGYDEASVACRMLGYQTAYACLKLSRQHHHLNNTLSF